MSGWVLAVLALLLNAAAPVLGYLALPMPHAGHHRALARAATMAYPGREPDRATALARLSSVRAGESASPPNEALDRASGSHDPAPHCQYCLDFAAGAALGSSPFALPPSERVASSVPVSPSAIIAVRPSLRFALSRAPPGFA